MSRDQWEQAIARAVVEGTFRARLLADPADALADYGLQEGQRPVVEGMRATSLNEFAARFLHVAASVWTTNFDGLALESDHF